MMVETMKSSELCGMHVTIAVKQSRPCRIVMDGYEPLTETTSGTIAKFIKMPAGYIGILLADDGRRIAFDAGCDITAGIIEIEVPREQGDAP